MVPNHIHYMAPLQNVPYILAYGIFSYNGLKKNEKLSNISQTIADPFVNERRDDKFVKIPHTLHDFVPFYFGHVIYFL